MKVRILNRFVDEKGGRLFGPGFYDLDDATALRLIDQGKAENSRKDLSQKSKNLNGKSNSTLDAPSEE